MDLNIVLWILQGILAAFFAFPGFLKVSLSKSALIEKKMLAQGDSIVPVRFIGIMEVLGVIGIILPWLLNVWPILTPAAAVGFAIVMIGAFAVHFTKKDYKILPVLVLAFFISVAVAWFRFNLGQ